MGCRPSDEMKGEGCAIDALLLGSPEVREELHVLGRDGRSEVGGDLTIFVLRQHLVLEKMLLHLQRG